VRRKVSADVDGGLSGVSRCADTGARTPIGVSGIFLFCSLSNFQCLLLITCFVNPSVVLNKGGKKKKRLIYGQSAPGGPFHCEFAGGEEVF
jgi:hypothetical protein